MRYKVLFFFLLSLFCGQSFAKWLKINDVDFTWGPFKIYNITLFTETGEYASNVRPLMLSLKYDKPVDGRDFAISIARSWANLDMTIENQTGFIDRLRKAMPDLKPNDTLSYIALEDKGYFVVNDQVIPEEFSRATSDAILAIWLDPKVEISHKLVAKKKPDVQDIYEAEDDLPHEESGLPLQVKKVEANGNSELNDGLAKTEFQVDAEPVKNGNVKTKIEPAVPRIKQVVEDKPQANIVEDKKAELKAEEQPKLQEDAPKAVDPDNPEKEIRPIEDDRPERNRSPI